MSCLNCKDRTTCPDAYKDIAVYCGAYEQPDKPDNVNHPQHYQTNIKGLETIEIIYAALGYELFKGYCRGNVLKYLLRADKKNGIEDLKKAAVYLVWEIEIREGKEA